MSKRLNLKSRIGVFYCFEKFTRDLGDDEPAVSSLLQYILAALEFGTLSAFAARRWPGIVPKMIAYAGEFASVQPQPLSDGKSDVAFAVGVELIYESRVIYPGRTLAE